jgi:large subunit ribosomal protein L22
MKVHAIHKHAQVSPQKARKVICLIRGKDVQEAEYILRSLPHKSARLILKVLLSAKANAIHNFELNGNSLKVSEAIINMGTPWRRVMPKGMGRADIIKKRTSHILVAASPKEDK